MNATVSSSSNTFKINNFNLVRLLAAFQVALIHAIFIVGVDVADFLKPLLAVVFCFPGVPIFFFISGFLISRSFERNPVYIEYFQNRFLRLYPGLIVSIFFTYFLIVSSGYLAQVDESIVDHAILFTSKATIFQFYNPEFLRGYGDGVFNGNLWTITVEIQFYLLTPLLFLFLNSISKRGYNENRVLIGLICFFLVINQLYILGDRAHSGMAIKLMKVSFLPWYYMFLAGVLLQRYFGFFYRLLAGKFIYLLSFYIAICYLLTHYFEVGLGNNINPVVFSVLCLLIFSAAYSSPNLSNKTLGNNDISYGVYLYHMPIINFLMYKSYFSESVTALVALTMTLVLASLSWVYVENPCLKLKKHPLNPFNSGVKYASNS